MANPKPEPPKNCRRCPRLAKHRSEIRRAYPDWYNGATTSFGDDNARLLIVGLAPGLKGANRTGRAFTGDQSGALLFATLEKFHFCKGGYGGDTDDGVVMEDTMITNAVRCLPPQNKPIGAEIKQCRSFLTARIAALPNLRAILCLGKVAHDSTVAALAMTQKSAPFGHSAAHDTPHNGVKLFDSYHCSRYNTNTGRLTESMFHQVFASIQRYLNS